MKKSKLISKVLALLLCAALAFCALPFSASAAGDGYYTYTVTDGKATITYVDKSISGDVTIPSTLGGCPVVKIGNNAFSNCNSITGVTIPSSVTHIGNWAFFYCTVLSSIKIPDSVTSIGYNVFYGTAYYNNDSNWEDKVLYIGKHLIQAHDTISGNYSIKAGTLTIAGSAFASCDKLESITLPNTVKVIGDSAFQYCEELESITIPDSVKTIGNSAFGYCSILESITIPDSVKTIGNSAFYSCKKLESATLGNGVTTIGDSAFQYCEELESITIPDSVNTIGNSAFYYCKKLESATLGNGVTTIGDYAFGSCSVLESITIPKNVTNIGYNAFYDCYSLNNITVDKDNASYSSDDFGILFNKDKTELIKYPSGNKRTSYTVPDGVKKIADDAFEEADYLESVKLPSGVTTIGKHTFAWCDSLNSITIPKNVTDIAYNAFYDCYSLKKIIVDKDNKNYSNDYFGVLFNKDKTELIKYPLGNERKSYTVPDGVKKIADDAFEEADYLESVKLPNGITTISKYAFENCRVLSSITIPVSVTSIVQYAFLDCENLADVYYGGSEEAWGKISVGNYNNSLLGATVHYNTEIVNEVAETVAVATPSISTIKYGDSIVLHANLAALPDGMSLVWSADNANFEMNVSPDGATCTVTPKASGSTTFTVTVVDEDGDVFGTESQQLTSKAGFFDKILAFFKKIFGLTKVYPQMLGIEVK